MTEKHARCFSAAVTAIVFQKKEGAWRIAERTVVYDWLEEQTPPAVPEAERFGLRQPIGAAHPNDPVYALRKRRSSSSK